MLLRTAAAATNSVRNGINNTTDTMNGTITPPTTTPFVKKRENGRNTMNIKEHNYNNRTLLLLDFDDTLYPSTYIKEHNSNIDMELFKSYCHKSYKLLLSLIMKYGSENIYIITNADGRWITKCLKYLQKSRIRRNIGNLIINFKINVYSAKDQFGTKYPNDCIKWKQELFKFLIRKHYDQYILNQYIHNLCTSNNNTSNNNNEGECAAEIISDITRNNDYHKFVVVAIGDGCPEYIGSYQAVKELNINRNNNIILHRIRLLPKPSIPSLFEQFALIQLLSNVNVFDTELKVGIDINYKQEMSRHLSSRSNNESTNHPSTNHDSSSSAKSAKSEKQKEGEKQCRCHHDLNDHKQNMELTHCSLNREI